ncbi:MAG: UvrD-helicase domain-containing protein, partial [Thaumarchaeota archaeon]|nr:UvrD-helicase domain-containing protein [Nitrososphaerota archaeon]
MNHNSEIPNFVRNIVTAEDKRLRVMAGPGTGKSTALMLRVKRLLEQGQEPTRILAVTFTRTAATSLIKDLTELDVVGCEKVNAGTLHSYCFSLLNKTDVFEYHSRIPRPIFTFPKSNSLQFEGGIMLSDLTMVQEFGSKRSCTERIHGFESDWARLQYEQPGWPTDPTDRLFKDHLSAWLNFHRAMLLGELVTETLHFLRNNPESDVIGAFDHVIVDEYQDLNRAEQEV